MPNPDHPAPPPEAPPRSVARTAVFQGTGWPFSLPDRDLPGTLAPGEVLVAVRLATVCGSDLHAVDGRRREPTPSILGHEGVGQVVAVGSGRGERGTCSVGDRVTWTLAVSCGTCPACVEWDLPQKCDRLFKYGHAALTDGSGLNGCYASHLLIRPGTTVVRIPDGVSDSMAAPANCALATMVAAVEGVTPECRVAVVQGAGLLGIYGAVLLRSRGVSRVVIVDVHPDRLATAAAFGIEVPAGTAAGPVRPGGADLVVEVAGNAAVVQEGLHLLRPGGTYLWVGMVHPDTRLELTGEAVIRRCLRIRGVHNYAPRHLREAVEFLRIYRDAHPWDRLVSPPLPLAQLGRAFDLARTARWARVAVDPGLASD